MKRGLFRNLLSVARVHRAQLATAFVMVLISNSLLIANPLLLRQALFSVYGAEDLVTSWWTGAVASALGKHSSHVSAWALLLCFVALMGSYFKYCMRVRFVAVSREEERRVRDQLFSRLQSQSMAFYDRHSVGDLMSHLTNDIAAYREVLGPGIMYPLYFLTLVTPALVALYTISPPMATISLFPILVLPVLVVLVQKRVYGASKKVQEVLGEMSNQAHEHYSGIRMIKGYCAEQKASQDFFAQGHSYYQLSVYLACLRGIFYPCLTLFTKGVTVFLVVFTAYCSYHAWWSLSAADFVSFMWIQSQIFGPVLMLSWVLPLYQRGAASYDRLVTLYEESVEVKDLPAVSTEPLVRPHLKVSHLTFTYPTATQPTLRDVSFDVPYGQWVGITGPVGSGKTTLFRLLNREYALPKDTLYVGGKEIHTMSLAAIHQAFGVVEQGPFLFSQTIAENVRFGRPSATDSQVEGVARFADLHQTVEGFPRRYQTIVGERGVKLSGGQKQRVAIARTLLVDRPVLLLDDVFSAVDGETEERIFSQLSQHYRGRTVLLITHRVPVLARMDQILYFQEGAIVESGSPKELLDLDGRYAALVELQSLLGGLA